MRILSLNLWGGIEFDLLMHFLKEQKGDIDIFCFQEMLFGSKPVSTPENKGRENLFSEIIDILEGYSVYEYRAKKDSCFAGEKIPFDIGQAIFVKEGITVANSGGFRTYTEDGPIARQLDITVTGNCQWVELQGSQPLHLLNFHGLWQPGSHKLDTPERLEQSRILQEFLDAKEGGKILLGDFNMRPEIESMGMLGTGMTELVQKYGFTSTRSRFYEKPNAIQYSDYAFVSPDIEVSDFAVLPDEVSDHLPLLLEINYG